VCVNKERDECQEADDSGDGVGEFWFQCEQDDCDYSSTHAGCGAIHGSIDECCSK
jgi:hypothetical protein